MQKTLQFLETVPPRFMPHSDESSETKLRYTVEPKLVEWVSFLDNVRAFPVPDAPVEFQAQNFYHNSQLIMDNAKGASAAFIQNIINVATEAHRATSETSVRIAFPGAEDLKLFVAGISHTSVEMKPNSAIWYSPEETIIAIHTDVQHSYHLAVSRAVRQLFTYMLKSGSTFGVLSSYTFTWFFRRNIDYPHGTLLVSPCIESRSSQPTVARCLWWILRQPVSDVYPLGDSVLKRMATHSDIDEGQSTSESSGEESSSNYAPNTSDSGPSAPMATRSQTKKRRFNDTNDTLKPLHNYYQSSSSVTLNNHITVSQAVIESATIEAYNKENEVALEEKVTIVKYGLRYNIQETVETWSELQSLQGDCIPRLLDYGLLDGKEPAIVFEPFESVQLSELSSNEKALVLNILRRIYLSKVLIANEKSIIVVRSAVGALMLFGFGNQVVTGSGVTKEKFHKVADRFQKFLFPN